MKHVDVALTVLQTVAIVLPAIAIFVNAINTDEWGTNFLKGSKHTVRLWFATASILLVTAGISAVSFVLMNLFDLWPTFQTVPLAISLGTLIWAFVAVAFAIYMMTPHTFILGSD